MEEARKDIGRWNELHDEMTNLGELGRRIIGFVLYAELINL